MRADRYLVEKHLVASRSQAQTLIEEGHVFSVGANGSRELIKKSSQKLIEPIQIEISKDAPTERYVSRGGLKLEGALAHLENRFPDANLDLRGALVLDVGLSTGGFSDCVLQKGARQVVGIDVGHGQLSSRLRNEPRLKSIEGLNARHLAASEHKSQILALTSNELFDLITVDLSFISLTLVLSQLVEFLEPNGRLLALVKPQFEVGREGLGKNGIVKDPELWQKVEEKIKAAAAECDLQTEDYFESSITGGDGNKEFFAYFCQ